MKPSRNKLPPSIEQSNISLMPLTQKNRKVINSTTKQFEKKLNDANLYLIYNSHPQPIFSFKVVMPSSSKVYEIQINKQVLTQMDPAVLATFDTLQSMYSQFVEIIKTQPQDLSIGEDGILKIKITVAMKSGIKKKELVLETDCRGMTQAEELKLQLQAHKEISERQISQLKQAQEKLKKQISQLKQQNKQLKNVVKELSGQLRSEVEGIKLRQSKQKSSTQAQINILKSDVNWIKQGMHNMDNSLKFFMIGAKKIFLVPNNKNKCFWPGHKQNNSFKLQTTLIEGMDVKKITKIGKQKWAQIIFDEPINPTISYFELQILKTKNNYVCVGVCAKGSLEQEDSKWSKNSITLFLLDKSIISEGKEVENTFKNQQNNKKTTEKQTKTNINQTKSHKIRVIINCINKTIEWFQNQSRIGTLEYSQQFSNHCKANQIHPLVICADEEDEILLR